MRKRLSDISDGSHLDTVALSKSSTEGYHRVPALREIITRQ